MVIKFHGGGAHVVMLQEQGVAGRWCGSSARLRGGEQLLTRREAPQ